MKTNACAILSGVVAFVSSQLLLQWQYPWSTYYGSYPYGRGVTLASYLLVSLVLALITAGTTVFLFRASKIPILARALLCGLAVFLISMLWAISMGPMGLDVPGLRLRGIFFCEFEFLRFTFMVAAPVSCIAAAVCWWLARTRSGAASA